MLNFVVITILADNAFSREYQKHNNAAKGLYRLIVLLYTYTEIYVK